MLLFILPSKGSYFSIIPEMHLITSLPSILPASPLPFRLCLSLPTIPTCCLAVTSILISCSLQRLPYSLLSLFSFQSILYPLPRWRHFSSLELTLPLVFTAVFALVFLTNILLEATAV